MTQSDSTRDRSPRYTHGHESSTLASHGARTASNSCAYLLPHLRPGMSILDIGSGPGSITLDLAQIVSPGRVTGIENVEAPLSAARELAEARGDRTTVFEVGDALALAYPDASFDVVHAHQVLQHLPDPVTALREMWRVCKPGGWIAVRDADYAAMAWHPENAGVTLWRDTYRALAKSNCGEPDAGRHLREWARLAGIESPTISTSTWTYADPESTLWWGTSQADRYSAPVFRRQAVEHGLTDADVEAIAHGWRDWAAHPDAWFTIVHVELLASR